MLARPETVEQRYAICQSCSQLSVEKICKICNCIMPFKTKLAKGVCPLDKWQAEKQIPV